MSLSLRVVLLLAIQLALAQTQCSTRNRFCNIPSTNRIQTYINASRTALQHVNVSLNVPSPFGTNCGNNACSVESSEAKRERERVMKYATAMHEVLEEGGDAYLETVAGGCPNVTLLSTWVNVATTWANRSGFTGNLSIQGETEVDWKLNMLGAAYIKLKPYLTSTVRSQLETWMRRLYDQAARRINRSDNNHWAWHLSGMLWLGMAVNNSTWVTSNTNALLAHMNKTITSQGVIRSEARCRLTQHYHQFYLQAALGGLLGHKYYFGTLPTGYTSSLQSRVRSAMTLVNGGLAQRRVLAAFFNYPDGTQCSAGSMTAPDPKALLVVNGTFEMVTKRELAPPPLPCVASSYFGKLRYHRFQHRGFVHPPLQILCCHVSSCGQAKTCPATINGTVVTVNGTAVMGR